MRVLLRLLPLLFVCGVAHAQSSPNWAKGKVPTAAEWNAAFAVHADVNSGTLNSPQINGTVGGSPTIGGIWMFSANGTAVAITNNATIGGTLAVTGATTLHGGTFSGTFAGAHTYSGNVTFSSGIGTLGSNSAAGSFWIINAATANERQVIFRTAGSNRWYISANSDAESGANAGSNLDFFNYNDAGSGVGVTARATRSSGLWTFNHGATVVGNVTGDKFQNPGATQTLSGTTLPTQMFNFSGNLAGTSTLTGSDAIYFSSIGSASDTLAITNGALSYAVINATLGTGFDGSRNGLLVSLQQTGATTSASVLGVGMQGVVTRVGSSVNSGGVSTGYGVSAFGSGSLFGAVLQTNMNTGATWQNQAVGLEIDNTNLTGTNVIRNAGIQLVHQGAHAVQGKVIDTAIAIADQSASTVGWKVLISHGQYASRWPGDPDGYTWQVEYGAIAPTGAAAFDLNQLAVSGANCGNAYADGSIKCPEGGGFYWRNPGLQLLNSAAQIGYGEFAANANGLVLDTTYQQMATVAGSITVAAAGSNFTTGDVACDIYGDCVVLTASAGSVTAVSSVLSRGWQKSPPADPVTFVARTRNGSTLGTGLTLNLIGWTAKHQIQIGSLTSDVVIGGATQFGALNATAGFLHLPFTNATSGAGGIPTGTPANTNGPACVWNDVTFVLNCYSPSAGAWKHVSFSASAG